MSANFLVDRNISIETYDEHGTLNFRCAPEDVVRFHFEIEFLYEDVPDDDVLYTVHKPNGRAKVRMLITLRGGRTYRLSTSRPEGVEVATMGDWRSPVTVFRDIGVDSVEARP